ncbi:MAG TPA: tetratricopeptide repeat protein, partial [Victivallales bacterium]|nr:tetratricopeptide repeat protein [Victivallales bacterium]
MLFIIRKILITFLFLTFMLCINVTLYSNSFFNEIKNLLDSHKTTGLEHYRFNDELSLNLKKEFKILSKATKDNNSKLRDSTLYNIINIYIASGTYDKAKKYALELQKAGIYEKNDETTGTAKYLLGTIYNNISKYDLALKNYTDAYRYLKHNQALLAALY